MYRRKYHKGYCERCRCLKEGKVYCTNKTVRPDVYCHDPFQVDHPFEGESTIRCKDFWFDTEKK